MQRLENLITQLATFSIWRDNWGLKIVGNSTRSEVEARACTTTAAVSGDELEIEVGGFDAEFPLDFFAEQVGCFYYNQGLADALSAIENKIQKYLDLVYELEIDTDLGAWKK